MSPTLVQPYTSLVSCSGGSALRFLLLASCGSCTPEHFTLGSLSDFRGVVLSALTVPLTSHTLAHLHTGCPCLSTHPGAPVVSSGPRCTCTNHCFVGGVAAARQRTCVVPDATQCVCVCAQLAERQAHVLLVYAAAGRLPSCRVRPTVCLRLAGWLLTVRCGPQTGFIRAPAQSWSSCQECQPPTGFITMLGGRVWLDFSMNGLGGLFVHNDLDIWCICRFFLLHAYACSGQVCVSRDSKFFEPGPRCAGSVGYVVSWWLSLRDGALPCACTQRMPVCVLCDSSHRRGVQGSCLSWGRAPHQLPRAHPTPGVVCLSCSLSQGVVSGELRLSCWPIVPPICGPRHTVSSFRCHHVSRD